MGQQMDFSFTEEQEAFRKEIVAFIKSEVPPGREQYDHSIDQDNSEEAWEFALAFAKKLVEKRWLCIGWPKEFGGGGYGPVEQAIFQEELCYHHAAYHSVINGAIDFVGPAIMRLGSDEQKRRFLPEIARGELRMGLGLTEPDAGSDLASLKARAVRVGNYYILNGQKTYQTWAHRNEFVALAVRTDPNVPKYKGISVILCDLKSPGVSVRPQYGLDGRRLSDIFLEDVKVPQENLLGDENQGWSYITMMTTFERKTMVMRTVGARRRDFDDFVQFCRQAKLQGITLRDKPFVKHRLVKMSVELEVLSLLAWRVVCLESKNIIPTVEASAANLLAKEWQRKFAEGAMEILGAYAQLEPGSKWAPLGGRIQQLYMGSFGLSAAATPEIMKNIMAIRGLGLPSK